MDKNTVIALLLLVCLMFGYSYYESSNRPEIDQTTSAVTEADVKNASAVQQNKRQSAVAAVDSTALFYNCAAGAKDSMVVLENSKLRVELSTLGGTVANVYLKELKDGAQTYRYRSYKDFAADKNEPLHIYRKENAFLNFAFDSKLGAVSTGDYHFVPVAQTDSSVTMRLTAADSVTTFDIVYRLRPDSYMLDFDVVAHGLDKYVSIKDDFIKINWANAVSQLEKGFKFENQYSTLTYKLDNGDTEKLSEYEAETEKEFDGKLHWIAYKNQYFSSILIAGEPMTANVLESKPYEISNSEKLLKSYHSDLQTRFDPTGKQPTQFQFYFGPNQFRLLQSMDDHAIGGNRDLELEELVYLGWPIVRWINRFFTLYVFDFLTQFGLPMGVVLLLITILLRFIVYVPTKKSYLSSARMRVLKPKVDEIAKKYPKQEDAMRRQQEMMTLYSQYGVSPMGGCLPMLIQLPIWIAMFNFVPNAIELRQQGFLWAEDLSTYDSILSWDTDLWLIGDHLSLFCLLFCATNVLYTFMTMRQQRESMSGDQAEQMKMMQWMMYFMPVFFFFMFNDYSSGLNYYYFISLLASALTMWYLRKTTDDKRLLAKLEANYEANKNNPNKKPSGMAARLEALRKQQEAMMEEQRRRQQQGK